MQAADNRPTPKRVARRAMVLALVMYRAALEQFPGKAKFESLHGRIPAWIEQLGLDAELELKERDFLNAPLGQADEKVTISAVWQNEGLAVLAWALRRFALPQYDEQASPEAAGASIGFDEDLLDRTDTAAAEQVLCEAKLRPPSEIDRYATHITLVNWRLRTFRLNPAVTPSVCFQRQPDGSLRPIADDSDEKSDVGFDRRRMDFAGYLRAHPSFNENWLEGLRLVGGDLALRDSSPFGFFRRLYRPTGKAIGDATEDDVQTCLEIVIERHIAAYWLQGDNPVYSQVDPSTILTGLR
jgi:hypothetical protein